MPTLDELKAMNAEAEQKAQDTPQEQETIEHESDDEMRGEVEEADEQEAEDAEGQSEDSGEEVLNDDLEDWLLEESEDEESSEADKKPTPMFTSDEVKAARIKEREKIERHSSKEINELKAQIEALKNNAQPAQANAPAGRPQLEDYYQHDDPQAAYEDDLYKWRKVEDDNRNQVARQAEMERERAARISNSVEQHYERAGEFAKKNNIAKDAYISVDKALRDAVEEVAPGFGDTVIDDIIDSMGEGSERVAFHVGRSKERLRQVQNAIRNDPRGVKLSMLLGKFQGEINSMSRRKSQAPKPAARIKGDATATPGSKLQKQYEKAKTTQERIDIRRKARQQKLDTSNW